MFCQATGYGGTTQRVTLQDWEETQKQQSISEGTPNSTATGRKLKESFMEKLYSFSNVALPKLKQQQHGANTWTDEEAAAKLASLKPNLTDGRLIRVCFDSTVGDVLPWSFVPAQPFVKVVPIIPPRLSQEWQHTTFIHPKLVYTSIKYNAFALKSRGYYLVKLLICRSSFI